MAVLAGRKLAHAKRAEDHGRWSQACRPLAMRVCSGHTYTRG